MRPILEVCTDCIESVKTAKRAGASRVELCSGLSEGGVTPSIGLIHAAVAIGIDVNVLIRPRSGDFVYSNEEVEICCHDIRATVAAGVHGVVIGALTSEGDVDIKACKTMMDAAEGVSVTFHRAFDLCRNPKAALENIIALRCHRLLTSGQAPSAELGVKLLTELNTQADNRIIIMPGAGVNPNNARYIMEATGVKELHASCREPSPSAMKFRNESVTMGASDSDEYSRMVASEDIIRKILQS